MIKFSKNDAIENFLKFSEFKSERDVYMINLKIGNIRLKLIAYYWDGLKNNIKGNSYFFFFFLLCSCVSKVDTQINHKKVTITEIYKACDDNDSKTIEMWLKSGGDVNVVHPDRGPLIWEACVAGHPNIIKMLIKAGAKTDISLDGRPLMIDICSDIFQRVNREIRKHEQGPNFKDNDFVYPKYEIVQLLIEAGVDLNKSSSNGDTALNAACYSGSLDVVELLIKNGARINVINQYGSTPLHSAVIKNHKKIVELLLSLDIKSILNMKDEFGSTPLYMACRKGFNDIAKMLIKAGADVNIPNRDGLTPLHEASIRGNTEIIRALIDAGANIHAKDKLNHRPFDYFNIKSQYREKLLKGLIKSN